MAQVHSRPGFQPRVTHEGRKTPPPAKVTPDMRNARLKTGAAVDLSH